MQYFLLRDTQAPDISNEKSVLLGYVRWLIIAVEL
jgi:hypothetical protein